MQRRGHREREDGRTAAAPGERLARRAAERARSCAKLAIVCLALGACRAPDNGPDVAGRASELGVSFPLQTASDARTLVDAAGTHFPILGRASWAIAALSKTDYQSYLDDTAQKGFDTIECFVPAHHPSAYNRPFDAAGNAPFLKRLDGGAWSGSLSYGSASAEAPDFTTPNEAYWASIDGIVSYAASKGIVVLMFPAYVGYGGGDQGWMVEMSANGQARMKSYGSWIAARYANATNIIWMLGGDQGSFDSTQTAAEQGLIDGLHTGPSRFYSAEWDSNMIGKDQSTFAASITLDSVYSFQGNVTDNGRRAYAYSPPLPAFLLEEPYDQEGPDGSGFNSAATQPVRRFEWWGWLSTIGGYVAGNGYVWPFQPGTWQQHLNTQSQLDEQRLNTFIRGVDWTHLVPSGLSGMRTIVTAGGGYPNIDYVTAAATPDGKLALAYVPPAHSGPITVDMATMSATTRARWFNPTTASYTSISSGYSLANSGTQTFSVPGDNGTGSSDWLLVLDVSSGGGTGGSGGSGGGAGAAGGAGSVTGGSGGTGTGMGGAGGGGASATSSGGASATSSGGTSCTSTRHGRFRSICSGGSGAVDAGTPNAAPTVASAAAASPATVTGTTTMLSVLGSDDRGEAALSYAWSASGPASVTFSASGTNAAKTSTATFSQAGSYTLTAVISDAGGLQAQSSVTVMVKQTASSIAVTPASASVAPAATQAFSASERDQFGAAMASQPSFAWSVTGGGSISSSGLFTASSTAGGPFTVAAADGSLRGSASVTVTGPTIAIGESAVLGTDDCCNSNLLIAQGATLAQAATLRTLSFYASIAAGTLRLGLYDASGSGGGPGKKIAETAEFAPVVGWNTVAVTAQTRLAAGSFWLVYLPSSDGLHFPKANGSVNSVYGSFAYGPLPAVFPSSGFSTTPSHWSFYATLAP